MQRFAKVLCGKKLLFCARHFPILSFLNYQWSFFFASVEFITSTSNNTTTIPNVDNLYFVAHKTWATHTNVSIFSTLFRQTHYSLRRSNWCSFCTLQERTARRASRNRRRFPTRCYWGNTRRTASLAPLSPPSSSSLSRGSFARNNISPLQNEQNFLLPWISQRLKWKSGSRIAELNPSDYRRQSWKSWGWQPSRCCLLPPFRWASPWEQLCSEWRTRVLRSPRTRPALQQRRRWATASRTAVPPELSSRTSAREVLTTRHETAPSNCTEWPRCWRGYLNNVLREGTDKHCWSHTHRQTHIFLVLQKF